MAAKTRKNQSKKKKTRTTVENRNALTSFVTNPMILVLLITAGGVILAAKFWSDYRTTLRGDQQFAIDPDKVTMTAQPDWIHSDFRQTALSGFDWQNRSLLDATLVKDLGQHLQKQLWVEQVTKVQKDPTGLQVDLQFRRPVAMVELQENKLFPVDRNGVVLDGREFSLNQSQYFLRISIAGISQQTPPLGAVWTDPRVVQASAIAEAVLNTGVDMGIVGIYGHSNRRQLQLGANQQQEQLDTEFRFWTAERNEIIWGHAIGSETAGEANAIQKLSALIEITKRNGKVDQLQQLLMPNENVLDLRSGKLVQLQGKSACVFSEKVTH